MERAAAMPVLDSTLQRQSKDFFQNLTVEVSGSTNAAMVYALTWSAREALGNVALLEEIDKLPHGWINFGSRCRETKLCPSCRSACWEKSHRRGWAPRLS